LRRVNREEADKSTQDHAPDAQLRHRREERHQKLHTANGAIELLGIMPEAVSRADPAEPQQIDQAGGRKQRDEAVGNDVLNIGNGHGALAQRAAM